MRKLTTLFVAAVAAMSVNAQNASDLEFFTKVNYGADSAKIVPSTVNDGVIEIKAGAKVADPWDNQFWIVAPKSLGAGTYYSFSMDIKADSAASISNQIHGEAGAYVHYTMFDFNNVNFTTDWKTFEFASTMQMAGQSIALNLNDFASANNYYIKNVKWNTAAAAYRLDSISYQFIGDVPTDLKADNFTVFVNSVSSTAEFNAMTSVSTTINGSVSSTVTTVFNAVSNTLDTFEIVDFAADDNIVTMKLAKEIESGSSVYVAYNNYVVKASYVKATKPAINTVAAAEFSVYPNPVNDVLNVACEAGVANVAIFDIAGRMVKVSNEDVINVADLKAGMYIVKVTDMNGANGTVKIMK